MAEEKKTPIDESYARGVADTLSALRQGQEGNIYGAIHPEDAKARDEAINFRSHAERLASERFHVRFDVFHRATASPVTVEIQWSRAFEFGRVTTLTFRASAAFRRAVHETFSHAFSPAEWSYLQNRHETTGAGLLDAAPLDDNDDVARHARSIAAGVAVQVKQKMFEAGSQRVTRELVGKDAREIVAFADISGDVEITQVTPASLPDGWLEILRKGLPQRVEIDLAGAPPAAPRPRGVGAGDLQRSIDTDSSGQRSPMGRVRRDVP
jgi:hypothetical protein